MSMAVINTSPVTLFKINEKRKSMFIQNNGETLLYCTKQNPGMPPNVPSTSNFDFVLYPSVIKPGNDDKAKPSSYAGITVIEIESIAGINIVSSAAGGIVSGFEISAVVSDTCK